MPARRSHRAGRRGAAMVEAICVISIFIGFFLAMVFFYSLYHQKLRVRQLARTAALAYAMDACQDADPLQIIKADLGNASGQQSAASVPGSNVQMNNSAGQIGDKGGDPVGGAMDKSGFAGFQIATQQLNSKAESVVRRTILPDSQAYSSDVRSESYMLCGDPQKNGDPGGAWTFIKDSFSLNLKSN